MSEVKLPLPEFKVLRASAGSGKTYALVKHYLKTCLTKDDVSYFKHILAITFTNKAADEMKVRVIETMKGIGNHDEKMDSMAADLSAELGIQEPTLRKKAEDIYLRMMTNYGQIGIMTIDKFVNRLVKSFAFDLKFDGDYRIELDDTKLIETAVDELLSKVGEDKLLTELLEKFVEQRVDDEASWKVRDDLVRFGKLLFKEEVKPVLASLEKTESKEFIALHRAFLKAYHDEKKAVILRGEKALKLIQDHQLQDAFSGNFIPKYFLTISKGKLDLPNATVRKQFLGEKDMVAKKETDALKQAVHAITPQLTDYYEGILGFFEGEEGRILQLKKAIANHILQLAVLSKLHELISEIQLQNNAYTFADLNQKIQEVVSDNPAPFIYERLGERYHHFLIDEFQDTSVLQWQNFLPLVENALAKANLNLIVGDGKQAIYRWRNGDVRQLQQLPELIRPAQLEPKSLAEEVFYERQASLQRNYKGEVLPDNWRSAHEVVSFNNTLFDALALNLPSHHKSIYEGQHQNPKGVEGGWVTVQAYHHRTKADLEPDRNERIIALIKEQEDLGYERKDIAILVRKKADGSSIAQALLEANIHTITDESLALGAHPAPQAVIALMKALSNDQDEASAVAFIQCLSAIRPEFVLNEVFEKYIQLPEEKYDKSSFDLKGFIRENMPRLQVDQLLELTLYEFMTLVSQELGLTTKYVAYAEALLQLALEHQSQESLGFAGFIEFWENHGQRKSIKVPDTIQGVRVMTVHKSKGLEFPVVIAVQSASKGGAHQLFPVTLDPAIFELPAAIVPLNALKDTWAHAQYEAEKEQAYLDDMNVTYVALTRAEKHLHVLLEVSDKPKGEADFNTHLRDQLKLQVGNDIYSDRIACGKPLPQKKTTNNDTEVGAELTDIHVADNELRLRVGVENPLNPLEDNQLTPRGMGQEVHKLLEKVKVTADFDRFKSMPWPWQQMSKEEWAKVLSTVEAVLQMPECQQWFSKEVEVLNEQELLDPQGKSHRPDRVVMSNEELIVIDYKTGKEEKKHLKQVKEYMDLLSTFHKGVIKGFLLYTDTLHVVEMS